MTESREQREALPPNKTLTYRQGRFVEEYVKDPSNASAAAKRAGYSVNTAKEQAYQLLQKTHIKEKINEVTAEAFERLGITKERIIQELASIGFANLKHIVTQDKDGNTDVNITYLPDSVTAPITEVTVTNKKGKKDVKIKLADKRQALIDMAKMAGWMKEKVEVSGNLSLESLIEQSFSEEEDAS